MIVFLTNYLNLHQLMFANRMYELLGENFRFIATTPMTEERKRLGFVELNNKYPYVVRTYENEIQKQLAEKLIDGCDALVVGSVDDAMWRERAKNGKLTIRYSERFFKTGVNLHNFLSALIHLRRYQRYSALYFLCNSAFTPFDVNLFSNYKRRTFKWGYFPETIEYDLEELISKKAIARRIQLLWVGRLIDWKHPEEAVKVAVELKKRQYEFDMKIVGDGPMFCGLNEMIKEKGIDDCVHLCGAMPPEQVRKCMESASIFLFTSDRNEGWGAVLNEAMNSGCAVVTSHSIGSVPFLISENENGLIYENGNIEALIDRVVKLIDNKEFRKTISKKAYYTIHDLWNGKVAAERLIRLIEQLGNGDVNSIYSEGPCSIAEVIKDDWYKADE